MIHIDNYKLFKVVKIVFFIKIIFTVLLLIKI